MGEVVLGAHQLVKRYPPLSRTGNPVTAVEDVNFDLRPGETLGVVGESGCGKSTLARLLLLLDSPTAGEVSFRGEIVDPRRREVVREYRRAVQGVLQDPFSSLSPRMRVHSIVEEPLIARREAGRAARGQLVASALDRVGLPSGTYARRYPHELSGGQRQRVAIARAIVTEPEFLILDEPVSALDVSVRAQILNLLLDLREQMNLGYVLISHNMDSVRLLADKTAVMYLGRFVEVRDTRSVLTKPAHPYAAMLMAAERRWSLDPVAEERQSIGEVPDPADRPPGCQFHPRCPFVMSVCRVVEPEAGPLFDGWATCHLIDAQRACEEDGGA